MNDENKIVEELQEQIHNLEQTLMYSEIKLKTSDEEKNKIFAKYETVKEYKEYKKIGERLGIASASLFLFICICIGVIVAYGSEPGIFYDAFYCPTFSTIITMLIKCVFNIFYTTMLFLVLVYVCSVMPCLLFDRIIKEHPTVVFLIISIFSGIFVSAVIIKNVFW